MFTAVQYSDKVALQSAFFKENGFSRWLSGHGDITGHSFSTCPQNNFPDNTWTECSGVGWYIHGFGRKSGEAVLSGDLVAFAFTRMNNSTSWLSMVGGIGGFSTCPGAKYENDASWNKCRGDAFKIYAKGRKIGEPIRNLDLIALRFYDANNANENKRWLTSRDGKLKLSTCPGVYEGSTDLWTNCSGENFTIRSKRLDDIACCSGLRGEKCGVDCKSTEFKTFVENAFNQSDGAEYLQKYKNEQSIAPILSDLCKKYPENPICPQDDPDPDPAPDPDPDPDKAQTNILIIVIVIIIGFAMLLLNNRKPTISFVPPNGTPMYPPHMRM
jgi:hypothetical protein